MSSQDQNSFGVSSTAGANHAKSATAVTVPVSKASKSVYIPAPEDHIKRERARAKILKQSKWWKRKLLNGVCYHCDQRFSKQDLTMDHLLPVGRGGFSDKTNVVVSCKDCNTKKAHKMPWEDLDFFP